MLTKRVMVIIMANKCGSASDNEVIEVRQVQDMAHFPPEVQRAAGKTRLGPG